jgi:hypothetical protein
MAPGVVAPPPERIVVDSRGNLGVAVATPDSHRPLPGYFVGGRPPIVVVGHPTVFKQTKD